MSATKVFIEPNEDIVFACSKIAAAPSRKVIVVVPNGANITSSQVSLKLLTRMLMRTDKLIVLVSEDELGVKLAKKAGVVIVPRVSDVTNDTWTKVNEIKEEQAFAKDQKKIE